MVTFGKEWSDLVWNGHAWFGMVRFALSMSYLDLRMFTFDRSNLYRVMPITSGVSLSEYRWRWRHFRLLGKTGSTRDVVNVLQEISISCPSLRLFLMKDFDILATGSSRSLMFTAPHHRPTH